MNNCISSTTQPSDDYNGVYHNGYVSKIVAFLERANGLAEDARRNGSLRSEQQVVLEEAKNAIAHFNAMVEEVTKHLGASAK